MSPHFLLRPEDKAAPVPNFGSGPRSHSRTSFDPEVHAYSANDSPDVHSAGPFPAAAPYFSSINSAAQPLSLHKRYLDLGFPRVPGSFPSSAHLTRVCRSALGRLRGRAGRHTSRSVR